MVRIAAWRAALVAFALMTIGVASNDDQRVWTPDTLERVRLSILEMFDHAMNSYFDHAYPADELMPLTCQGRRRGVTLSRGDMDEALGNFSLTVIDSLDTMYLLGRFNLFEESVKKIVRTVRFDSDVEVSVFEANIRVVGGLISSHLLAVEGRDLKRNGDDHRANQFPPLFMDWYDDELLKMAVDLADRLLPAFDTSPTGLPRPRVNLKRGISPAMRLRDRTTCTACAGSAVLEMSALSRLTDDARYETAARRAMNALWSRRNRHTNLVGNVLNVESGEWIRTDSSVGAGIDSYYEYLLKDYILFGEEPSLAKFRAHYDSVMRHMMRSGRHLTSVKMNEPWKVTSSIVDALSAFWPGLQTLIGDLQPAIQLHEIARRIVGRFSFMPEAIVTPASPSYRPRGVNAGYAHQEFDLASYSMYWSHYPLRPEFLESTYFLHRATNDPHYRDLGMTILRQLNSTTRVRCGFAGVANLRTMELSDQMDSYFIAETFKYLYLLFTDTSTPLPINMNDYVFTTEGHLLPTHLSRKPPSSKMTSPAHVKPQPHHVPPIPRHIVSFDEHDERALLDTHDANSTQCPNLNVRLKVDMVQWAQTVRLAAATGVGRHHQPRGRGRPAGPRSTYDKVMSTFAEDVEMMDRLAKTQTTYVRAAEFDFKNPTHVAAVKRMGVVVVKTKPEETTADPHGDDVETVQLFHVPDKAVDTKMALLGSQFMKEMIAINRESELHQQRLSQQDFLPHRVAVLSPPFCGTLTLPACPAQFGHDLFDDEPISGLIADFASDDRAELTACDPESPDLERAVMTHYMQQSMMPITSYERSTSLNRFIAVVRRGGCLFADKARTLQAYGARGVIVVDTDASSSMAETPIFSLSGDGRSDIKIPVVMLFGVETSRLLKARTTSHVATEGKSLRVMLSRGVPDKHIDGNNGRIIVGVDDEDNGQTSDTAGTAAQVISWIEGAVEGETGCHDAEGG